MSTPDWTATPPPEAMRAAITAAEYAAGDDPERCCAVFADSHIDPAWLLIAGVRLLAAVFRDGVDPTELRGEILGVAAQADAHGYPVSAALESVLLAEALAHSDLDGLHTLCAASHISVLDLAYNAACLAGQVIAAQADYPPVVFANLRYQLDGAP